MPQNFIACDREQELLLPPSLSEWLAEDHLAWFVLDAVAALELEAFYASYRRDGWGAAAHDPEMMVALLVYAYAIGERSSRAIERRCREDVAFRVITANQVLDHATIARFRVRHEAALGELFGQVLGLCADAGLVSVGVIALDGSRSRPPRLTGRSAATSRSRQRSSRRPAGSTRPRTTLTVPAAATSCPSSLRSARDGGRGCARRSSGSTETAPHAPSRSRAVARSGLRSASGGSSRTGRPSVLPTANTRRAGSAACSGAGASGWALGRGRTRLHRLPRAGSTRPTLTPGG